MLSSTCVVSVTTGALQVATCQPDKHCRSAGVGTFTLDGEESAVDIKKWIFRQFFNWLQIKNGDVCHKRTLIQVVGTNNAGACPALFVERIVFYAEACAPAFFAALAA